MPTPFAFDPQGYYEALDRRLCGMCGKNLDYWIFFICSPDQVSGRFFKGPAHHEECAKYAVLTLSTSHPSNVWLYRTRKYEIRKALQMKERVACYAAPQVGLEQIS
jgi:hypothetical protein